MISHRLSLALIASGLALVSCKPKQELQEPAVSPAVGLKSAYTRSASYGDFSSAAVFANQLIEAEPAEAGKWKEELAKIYFATQRQAACEKVCVDLIQHHGAEAKTPILEMRALSLEALGRKDEAIQAWLPLWQKNPAASVAVRLAGLQFELARLDEAEKTVATGLGLQDAATTKVTLPQAPGKMQHVPAAAALHNLKALILMKRQPDAKDAAKAELEAALALAPDFEIAKRNLAGLGNAEAGTRDAE